MDKKIIMLMAALFIIVTVQAQNNQATSPVTNGSGTYAPQTNPASGQSNTVVGTTPGNSVTPNTNATTPNNTTLNSNGYRTTRTDGTYSDSLSQIHINSRGRETNPMNPAIGTQSGTINTPTNTPATGNAIDSSGTHPPAIQK